MEEGGTLTGGEREREIQETPLPQPLNLHIKAGSPTPHLWTDTGPRPIGIQAEQGAGECTRAGLGCMCETILSPLPLPPPFTAAIAAALQSRKGWGPLH